jgi:hypothetical protein
VARYTIFGGREMIHTLRTGLSLAAFIATLTWGTLFAQEHPAGHEQHGAGRQSTQPQAAPAAEPKEIFCPTMKTGQLCSHGTADTLGLEGVKREAWIAAARRYNRAVDEATKHLLSDADSLLTPQEKAEVERWFAKGLNPQINQLLETAVNGSK